MYSLTIDFARAASRRISVIFQGPRAGKYFSIEALCCRDETFISDLTIDGRPVEDLENLLSVDKPKFTLSYTIGIPFESFMGAHKELNLNYPFINEREFFLGSGILPTNDVAENCEVEFKNLPSFWTIASSLFEASSFTFTTTIDRFEQFFIYGATDARIDRNHDLTCVISEKAVLPVEAKEIFAFWKASRGIHECVFGKLPSFSPRLLLVLQSPKDFQEIGRGKTFSTGENYLGGIAIYGPDRVDLVKKLGHENYLDFLLGGLHHEVGHAFTSAASFEAKSILFASCDCDREVKQILGEKLNGYFNGGTRNLIDSESRFSIRKFINAIQAKFSSNVRIYELDLFLFDAALRIECQISLYRVFCEAIERVRITREPYSSLDPIFDAAEFLGRRKLSREAKSLLLEPNPELYRESLVEALVSMGWDPHSLPEDPIVSAKFFLEGAPLSSIISA
jgi:hypothetical protein